MKQLSASMPSQAHEPTTASNLFRDGIHTIFAFLSLRELNDAQQSCHAWLHAAATMRRRALAISVVNDEPLQDLHPEAPASLTRHISVISPPVGQRTPLSTVAAVCRSFRFLHTLSCDLTPSREAQELEFHLPLGVLEHLTDLTLITHRTSKVSAGEILAALEPHLPRTLLRLQVASMHPSCLVLLKRFDVLEKLSLELDRNAPMPDDEDLAQALNRFGPTLTSLKVHRSNTQGIFARPLLNTLRLPRLRELDVMMQRCLVRSEIGYVAALAQAIPCLEELYLSHPHVSNLSDLHHFTHLTYLDLLVGLGLKIARTTEFVASLSQCKALTSLSFSNGEINLPDEEWGELFQNLPLLTSLSLLALKETTISFLAVPAVSSQLQRLRLSYLDLPSGTQLQYLAEPVCLTDLSIRSETFAGLILEELLATIGSPLVLPNLTSLYVDSRAYVGQQREFINFDWSSKPASGTISGCKLHTPTTQTRLFEGFRVPGMTQFIRTESLPPPP